MSHAKRGQRELAEDKRPLTVPESLENRWLWEPDSRPYWHLCLSAGVYFCVSRAFWKRPLHRHMWEQNARRRQDSIPKRLWTRVYLMLLLLDPLLDEQIYSISSELLSFAVFLPQRNSDESLTMLGCPIFSFVSIVSSWELHVSAFIFPSPYLLL